VALKNVLFTIILVSYLVQKMFIAPFYSVVDY
jgi:hypothetical protein